MRIFTNHAGYETRGLKYAVIEGGHGRTRFDVVPESGGDSLFTGTCEEGGTVAAWGGGPYARLDFSAFMGEGRFRIVAGSAEGRAESESFEIGPGILGDRLMSDILYYFKGQRCSGIYDRADRSAPVFGGEKRRDVSGGWYDASGDVSKYLSHLSYANYMNPQHIPLVVWTLLEAREAGPLARDQVFYGRRFTEEILHGADFLLRMQDEAGFFYVTLFDAWSKDVGKRELCSYRTRNGVKGSDCQAGFRQGGGMAIAALARASALEASPRPSDNSPAAYLEAAKKGFRHLALHNPEYLDDGKENIIDDYCALLAASELARAAPGEGFEEAADARAASLIGRLEAKGSDGFPHWRADETGARPFFHASDAGLPGMALLRYLECVPGASASAAVERALLAELGRTEGVHNPFGYPRQYVKSPGQPAQPAFFIPHENESGYWWQGENARVASLAAFASAAALRAGRKDPLYGAAARYATQCVDWVLGLNPFDACMMRGAGKNDPQYMPGYFPAPGGVCNGVTGAWDDDQGIAFLPAPQKDDPYENWRWGEQWLPHAAWLLCALGLKAKLLQAQGAE